MSLRTFKRTRFNWHFLSAAVIDDLFDVWRLQRTQIGKYLVGLLGISLNAKQDQLDAL